MTTIMVMVVAGALAWALLPPRARAAPTVPGSTAVHVIIVGPAVSGDLVELGALLSGLLQDAFSGGVVIGRADAFDERDLFRLDRTDADRPTTWVVIRRGVAQVRVAGAGREQYIFRDVAVSQPLTELDRERVSQLVKTALTTLIESGPGVLARRDAESFAGLSAATEGGRTRPPAVAADLNAELAGRPEPPVRLLLGALYQVQYTELGVSHGPGIVIGVNWTRPRLRPAAWLLLAYAMPWQISSQQFSGSDISLWGRGPVVRAGGSLALARWFGFDLGGGFTLLRFSAESDNSVIIVGLNQPPLVWVGRAVWRVGPASVGGWRASLAAVFEVANRSSWNTLFDNSSGPGASNIPRTGFFFHPGIALEIWSH